MDEKIGDLWQVRLMYYPTAIQSFSDTVGEQVSGFLNPPDSGGGWEPFGGGHLQQTNSSPRTLGTSVLWRRRIRLNTQPSPR